MATATGRHAHSSTHDGKKTLAQWFCLLGGAAFLLAGIAGMFVDSTFDFGSSINGDALLGLEVNGFHNVVHILSGIFLLAMSRTAPSARIGALVFGAMYLVVTLIGLIDGDTILGLLPVNGADNVFHLVTSLMALAAGALSPNRKSHDGRTIATDNRGADARSGRFERDADGVGTGYAHQGQREPGAVSASDGHNR